MGILAWATTDWFVYTKVHSCASVEAGLQEREAVNLNARYVLRVGDIAEHACTNVREERFD
jgi:hypothetical protein